MARTAAQQRRLHQRCRRWAATTAAGVVSLVVLQGMAEAAPGTAVWAARLRVEDLRVAIEPDPAQRVMLNLRFATERATELQYMASRGTLGDAPMVTANLKEHLAEAQTGLARVSDRSGHATPVPTQGVEAVENQVKMLSQLVTTNCATTASGDCSGLQSALTTSATMLTALAPPAMSGPTTLTTAAPPPAAAPPSVPAPAGAVPPAVTSGPPSVGAGAPLPPAPVPTSGAHPAPVPAGGQASASSPAVPTVTSTGPAAPGTSPPPSVPTLGSQPASTTTPAPSPSPSTSPSPSPTRSPSTSPSVSSGTGAAGAAAESPRQQWRRRSGDATPQAR